MHVGIHVKLLLESITDYEKVKIFQSLCPNNYVAATTYLQQNFPICALLSSSEKKSFHGKKCYLKSYTQIGQGV